MITSTESMRPLAEETRLCREAQRAWSRLPLAQRLRQVRRFRHAVVEQIELLCAAVAKDINKPEAETIASELLPLTAAARFLEDHARRLLRPQQVPKRFRPLWLFSQTDTLYRRPRGLVGIIGTWNYPLFLNGVQILQALTAGNGVLWKPSEVAPASASALGQCFLQAGFAEPLLRRLPATREGGRELAEAEVDHIVFTGSSATGRQLAGNLGRRLVSSTLELSGCDAQFVLEDADVELAVRAAWFGITLNRGQTCLAVRRVFVQRSIYAAFLDALRPRVVSARPMPLALPSQIDHAERLIGEALREGGRLLGLDWATLRTEGGMRPAVVVDARPHMTLCREACFAPLAAVLPFDTIEEALQADRLCPYALGASIFTRRPAWVEFLAEHLRAGSVVVNDVIAATAHPATPFGGRCESGWGVTQGAEGLLTMTVPQVVSLRSGKYRPHYEPVGSPQGMPVAVLQGLLVGCHAATWRQRLAGWLRLLKGWYGRGKTTA